MSRSTQTFYFYTWITTNDKGRLSNTRFRLKSQGRESWPSQLHGFNVAWWESKNVVQEGGERKDGSFSTLVSCPWKFHKSRWSFFLRRFFMVNGVFVSNAFDGIVQLFSNKIDQRVYDDITWRETIFYIAWDDLSAKELCLYASQCGNHI
jgi:hypothetical protein